MITITSLVKFCLILTIRVGRGVWRWGGVSSRPDRGVTQGVARRVAKRVAKNAGKKIRVGREKKSAWVAKKITHSCFQVAKNSRKNR